MRANRKDVDRYAGVADPVELLRLMHTAPKHDRRLANLLEIDLAELELEALRDLGQYIEIITCPVCTCFGPIHGQLNSGGHGRWAIENVRPSILPANAPDWEPSPWSEVAVRVSARRPTHAADCFLPTTLSQIGGFPAWVQDLEYLSCLKCGQTMTFIAQIDRADLPNDEGVYYAFACVSCRTTATTYQQT